MQAKQREKMRRIQMGEEVDVNDVEVPNDRFKPFNVGMGCGNERQVMEENRKYIQRVGAIFDLPSLTIPKVEVKWTVCYDTSLFISWRVRSPRYSVTPRGDRCQSGVVLFRSESALIA